MQGCNPMTKTIYYGHWICPFAKRVKFALSHKQIPHSDIEVPPSALRGKDHVLPPEFVAHSNHNEIPVICHDGQFHADSIPILQFLETVPSQRTLLTGDATIDNQILDRADWLNANLMMNAVFIYYQARPDWLQIGNQGIIQAFGQMETWLDGADWLAAQQPSIADVIAIPVYIRLDGLEQLGLQWDGPGPNVRAHIDRCSNLPGYETVDWTTEQTNEFVGRFKKAHEKFRRKWAAT